MSETSDNLAMPLIQPSQAQKHVTHNEALRVLDTLTQLSILSAVLSQPPGAPHAGDRYVVAAGGQLDWSGQDGNIAVHDGTGWSFHVPRAGWRAWDQDQGRMLLHDGTAWIALGSDVLNEVSLFGLGTTADASAPFAAKLNAATWTARPVAEGGDGSLLHMMNRESPANDLGLVFQTGFVARALLGLFGSDQMRLSVSQDGSNFKDALTFDDATGHVAQPYLPRFKAKTNFDNFVPILTWMKIAINDAEYNDQGTFDAATNLFTAPVAGTYLLGTSLMFKEDTANVVRMSGRLVINGTDVISGSYGENSGPHANLSTTLWLQTIASLNAGDTVELQGYVRGTAAYFAAEHTTFWGCKIG